MRYNGHNCYFGTSCKCYPRLLQPSKIFTDGNASPKKGSVELAGASLGQMVAGFTGLTTTIGVSTALETLCSQAWTDTNDKTLVGLHLQRAYVILGLMMAPIAWLWCHVTPALEGLGQDREVARYAGLYLWYFLPGWFAHVAFEAHRKYLQAQGIMYASTAILVLAVPLSFILHSFLVFDCALGFGGAPIALSLTHCLMYATLVACTRNRAKQTWGGWSWECMHGWGPFLRLAGPGLLTVCCEYWILDIATFGAAYLGNIQLASQSILMRIHIATNAVAVGLSTATAHRVGNLLGQGLPLAARQTFRMSCLLAFLLAAMNACFFLVGRSTYPRLFTGDEAVVQLVVETMPVFACFQLPSMLAGACAGVLRGLGRPSVSAVLSFVAHDIIAAPVAYFLAFHLGWSVVGLWTGLAIAISIYSVSQFLYLQANMHWSRECCRIECPTRVDYASTAYSS